MKRSGDAPADGQRATAEGADGGESVGRRIRMLRTAMGPEIAAALADPEVVEVMLNPDGSLWVDRLGTVHRPRALPLCRFRRLQLDATGVPRGDRCRPR